MRGYIKNKNDKMIKGEDKERESQRRNKGAG